MKFKHNLSKFTAVCLSAIIAVPCSTVYAAEEPILSKYKSFSDVFSESIDTKISDISYGIIRYPAIGADYAAELEKDDLTKLMNAYNNTKGICILAPMKDFDILNSAPVF